MDKILRCQDMGFDCTFASCGSTEEEIFKKAGEHARVVHNLNTASMAEKARGVIYEGYCDYGDTEDTISDECSECYDECYECLDECC